MVHPSAPLPLPDQAFLLYCDGLRSPAIAEQLHVPERTIRAWIAVDLDATGDVRRALCLEALERTVTRLQATAQAAWDAFERVADVRRPRPHCLPPGRLQ